MQAVASSIDDVVRQLEIITTNLSMLNKTIASRSFWDSQLAAAIIGAGSAILIVIMQYLWKRHKQQKEELDKIYSWIVESYNFWTPEN